MRMKRYWPEPLLHEEWEDDVAYYWNNYWCW